MASPSDWAGYGGTPASNWAEAYNVMQAKYPGAGSSGDPNYWREYKELQRQEAEWKTKQGSAPKTSAPTSNPLAQAGSPAPGGAPTPPSPSGAPGGGSAVNGLISAAPSASGADPFSQLPTIFNIGSPSQANASLGQRNPPMAGLTLAMSPRSY